VSASLWYQSITREYVEFLRDENQGNVYDWNNWGNKLFTAWDSGGRSTPVLIDSTSAAVPAGEPTAVEPVDRFPGNFRLFPPWPNPFNSTAFIKFTTVGTETVSLELYDLTGRRVAAIFNGRPGPGDNMVHFEAESLPSGLYIINLTAGQFSQEQKILLIR